MIPGQFDPSKLAPSKLAPSKVAPWQLAPWQLAPWTPRPMDSSLQRQLAPWTARPMDNSPHGQLAPWTTRPMDNSPHGGLFGYSDDSTSETCTKHTTYVHCQKNSEKIHNIFIYQCLKTVRLWFFYNTHIFFNYYFCIWNQPIFPLMSRRALSEMCLKLKFPF